MSTIVFTPFATFGQECGILYLLANYLNAAEKPILRASCNGIFSLCDRDQLSGWKRGTQSCLSCMSDQRNLALWSGIDDLPLSEFLLPEEIERTKRWVLGLDSSALLDVEFDGVVLSELCVGSFERRFGTTRIDLRNSHHEYYFRRLLLSAARMKVLMKRFLRKVEANFHLVAGGADFISATYARECLQHDKRVVFFRWSSGSRFVDITRADSQDSLRCEILLDDIASMRREVSTWPDELLSMLEELVEFVGYEPDVDRVAVAE